MDAKFLYQVEQQTLTIGMGLQHFLEHMTFTKSMTKHFCWQNQEQIDFLLETQTIIKLNHKKKLGKEKTPFSRLNMFYQHLDIP